MKEKSKRGEEKEKMTKKKKKKPNMKVERKTNKKRLCLVVFEGDGG